MKQLGKHNTQIHTTHTEERERRPARAAEASGAIDCEQRNQGVAEQESLEKSGYRPTHKRRSRKPEASSLFKQRRLR